jgi:hypothetical protein
LIAPQEKQNSVVEHLKRGNTSMSFSEIPNFMSLSIRDLPSLVSLCLGAIGALAYAQVPGNPNAVLLELGEVKFDASVPATVRSAEFEAFDLPILGKDQSLSNILVQRPTSGARGSVVVEYLSPEMYYPALPQVPNSTPPRAVVPTRSSLRVPALPPGTYDLRIGHPDPNGGSLLTDLRELIVEAKPSAALFPYKHIPTGTFFLSEQLPESEMFKGNLRADLVMHAWPTSGYAPASSRPLVEMSVDYAGRKIRFFTAKPEEIAVLKQVGWSQGSTIARVLTPVAGICDQGMRPVYRAFFAGSANESFTHRYMIDDGAYRALSTSPRWSQEGVAFCVRG